VQAIRDILLLGHRQAFTWIDEWFGKCAQWLSRRSRGLMSGSVSVLSDFVQTELRMCVIRCMCGFTLTTTKKQKNGFTAVPLYQHGFLHVSTGSCRSTQVSPGQPGFLQVGWAVNRSVENSHHSLSPLSSSPWDCLPLSSLLHFYSLLH